MDLERIHARRPGLQREGPAVAVLLGVVRQAANSARHGAARSFGIDFVIVEPGPASTSFGASIDGPEVMAAHDATPSGDMRRALASAPFVLTGDAARSVDAMIAVGDADSPALRLALTSTAYAKISKALTSRLSALEAEKAVATSADRDAVA